MIGGDVVRQHCQRAHAAQRAFAGQRAFPVRRAADVGALRAPVVQRAHRLAVFDAHVEHRAVDLAELFRLDAGFHHRIDLGVVRPDVFQSHGLAVVVQAKHVLLDVEAHRAGDGIRDHQRRRCQERLLRVRMDATVEVAIAAQHRSCVQIARDDFLLDRRIQRAAHSVAGGAGEADDAEAELFQLRQQAGVFQVQLHGLGARRQRGFHPRLAGQAFRIGVARKQRGGDHVARIAGVRAAGDRGDDHRAVRQQALRFLLQRGVQVAGDAALGEVADRQATMRVGRAGHRAYHARQIEVQGAFVLRIGQVIGPQTGGLRIGFHQCDLRVFATGQAQVIERVVVDEEHRRGRAVFRCHVADRGAVADGQRGCAFATELQIRADDFRCAQEFGQRQHHVGGGDAGLRLAGQFHRHDLRRAHPRRAPEHHVLRFQPAHADRNHAQRIDMRRVRIGTDAGVGKGHTALHIDHRRHFLQIDLMHDPVARRNHVHVLERLLGPVDEVETILVATVFDGAVFIERLWIKAAAFHRQRVIHDQLHRHHRVYLRRIAALLGDGIAQASQIDQRGLAEDVVADHPRREPREIEVATAFDQLQQIRIAHRRVCFAHDVLGVHAGGVGQRGIRTRTDRFDGGTHVEPVERGAGQGLAEIGVHGRWLCSRQVAIVAHRPVARSWTKVVRTMAPA